VTIHVATPLVANPDRRFDWWTGNLLDSMTRWSVPLFVMLSGALLLVLRPRPDARDFYRRRLMRLGLPFVTWISVYLVLGYLADERTSFVTYAVRALARGSVDVHLYFLFVIVGLYAVAPFLLPLVQHPDRRLLRGAVVVTLALGVASVMADMFLGIGEPTAFTRWLPFLGYFLAGAWLVTSRPTPRTVRIAALAIVAGVVATALGTAGLVRLFGPDFGRGRYLYEYLSVTTVPIALGMFVVLQSVGERIGAARWGARFVRPLRTLGEASFGIYLVHPLVLRGLGQLGLNVHAPPAIAWVTVMVVATSALSLVAVSAMRRLPVLRAAV
jgi:surface polysaccharide O-acyltransferase-like enzyme